MAIQVPTLVTCEDKIWGTLSVKLFSIILFICLIIHLAIASSFCETSDLSDKGVNFRLKLIVHNYFYVYNNYILSDLI